MTLMIDEDRLSETFAALANSTRRAILARLAEGDANVNELAEPCEHGLDVELLAGLGRAPARQPERVARELERRARQYMANPKDRDDDHYRLGTSHLAGTDAGKALEHCQGPPQGSDGL